MAGWDKFIFSLGRSSEASADAKWPYRHTEKKHNTQSPHTADKDIQNPRKKNLFAKRT